jgi:hypothetical protein
MICGMDAKTPDEVTRLRDALHNVLCFASGMETVQSNGYRTAAAS